MDYKAIYAYRLGPRRDRRRRAPSIGFARLGLDTVTMAGSYHAGKFLRPHGKAGKVYFPRTASSISSPTRSAMARSSRSRIRRSPPAPTSLRELAGPGSGGDERLARASAQQPARRSASRVDRRQRVRRPLRLQPLPVGARSARLRDRPGARSSPNPIRSPASRWRRPVSCPTRTATITSSRSFARTAGSIPSSASASASIAPAGAKRAGLESSALRRQVASDIEAYLASDVDFPDDMAEAFWLADARTDRRSCGVPRLALRGRDLAGRRNSRRRAPERDGRGDPLRRAADRRRLVRRQRSEGARRGRRHHRSVLLRAGRGAD